MYEPVNDEWELSPEEINALLPEELRVQWELLPEDTKAFLLAALRKRLRPMLRQTMLRAVQRDPNISEEERNRIVAGMTVDIANELMAYSDSFEVGGADVSAAPTWQQPQAGWLIAVCLIFAVRYFLRGGSPGELAVMIVLPAAAVPAAVMLSKKLGGNSGTLLVDRDTLLWNGRQWRWQDVTEIRFAGLGRLQIFAGDEKICTLSVNEKNVDRLVRYAEFLGISVTGNDG